MPNHDIKFECPVVQDPHVFYRIEEKLDAVVRKSSKWDWAYQNVKRIYWLGASLLTITGLVIAVLNLLG
jgi:hypothetical protein